MRNLILSLFLALLVLSPNVIAACTCADWSSYICVNSTHKVRTRICDPSGCDVFSQYVADSSTCQMPADASTFFNTRMIVAVIIIGLSAGIAFYVGGDYAWVVFVTMTGIFFLMATLLGVYPNWIIILAIIGVGGVFMKIIIDAIRG